MIWFLGFVIIALVLVICLMWVAIKDLESDISVQSHEQDNTQQGTDGELKAMTVKVEQIQADCRQRQEELEAIRGKMVEMKGKYGLVRRYILTAIEDLRGHGYKSKSGLIEHSKAWKQLERVVEELGRNGNEAHGNGGNHQ